jgi:hypothetical protein
MHFVIWVEMLYDFEFAVAEYKAEYTNHQEQAITIIIFRVPINLLKHSGSYLYHLLWCSETLYFTHRVRHGFRCDSQIK